MPCAALTPEQSLLAAKHVRLVKWAVGQVLRAHPGSERLREDLEQAGMEGLLLACRGYRPQGGAFSTYALLWIKQYALNEWMRSGFSIARPRLGNGGRDGRAPPLEHVEEHEEVEASGVEEALDARRIRARVAGELVRRMPYVPDAERTAAIYLDWLLEERTDAEAGKAHGITRTRAAQLRARARRALEEFARDLREEG